MLPLVDTHVHLLAGLDDGPGTMDEAVAMCRMLVAEGARAAAALAHQNDGYPDNLPPRLRQATDRLTAVLAAEQIPLAVRATGEVMATADLPDRLAQGRLLPIADRGQFLLVEMPHGLFVDLRPIATAVRPKGVRLIVAHAERYPELLHDPGLAEAWIAAGCLIQVTTTELADPPSAADGRAMRDWAKRGVIHLLGSDGHGLGRRPPRMRAGYEVLRKWVGPAVADRAGHILATAVFEGRPVNPPPPLPRPRTWFARLFGG